LNTTILESDFRLRHQILDRARDQHFSSARFGGDTRADVKREAEQSGPAHLVFTGMQSHPDLQSQRTHCLADRSRALDCCRRRLECREQSIPRRHDFLPAQCLQLFADGCVVVLHHLCPPRIAEACGLFRGPDDVDNQDRGKRLLRLGAAIGRPASDGDASASGS
jgi:hypothetical protein